MDIITTIDLTKKFNDFTAVDHISFSVKKGEIFGFLGPNGAGKTTTIKMLTTLLYPTEGSATLSGFDIIKERDDVRQKLVLYFKNQHWILNLLVKRTLIFMRECMVFQKIKEKTVSMVFYS